MKRNIYKASCNDIGGLYRYEMNESGMLEFKSKTDMSLPMYMAEENNKMYVLLRQPVKDSDESGLIVYDIDSNGDLANPSGITMTKGIVACHLSVDNGTVYCVNYLSGNVVKLPDTVVTHSGKGPHPTRQTSPHTHFVCVTHDGYVLATDLGIDSIFTYTKDLKLVSQVKVPLGHGVRHLAFSEDKKYLYAVNELASTVSVFKYNDGHLELLDTYDALPKDFSGESIAAAIRIRGNTVYVSNRGHDSVAVFKADGEKLKFEKFIMCGGKEPRDFNIFGDILISANQGSDNVTVINLKTDKIIQTVNGIKEPLCVI